MLSSGDGEYEIRVGNHSAPRVDPEQVRVMAQGGPRSHTIEVPFGESLEVSVQAKGGWGIEGAALELQAVDTSKLRVFEAETPYGGKHTFEHMLPGKYQLTVEAEGFQRWIRSVFVPEDGAPEPVVVELVRT